MPRSFAPAMNGVCAASPLVYTCRTLNKNKGLEMAVKLGLGALQTLDGRVAVPAYERDRLSAGILHFGVGNFHRAHQAVYLDALFSQGKDHDWALVGAGVREGDKAVRKALAGQDWLTTVAERGADSLTAQVTGAMIDFVEPCDGPAILERLADPAIRIVSLTVTEGGYFIDAALGAFDAAHPEIVRDAAHMDSPRTVFGLILAGLMRRRAAGTVPFTVMSCDNLPGNGHVTQDAVVGLARLFDEELADWVKAEVAFPNGMVDRITPATSDLERALVREEFGIEDAWPVTCEPFKQWVLEDRFTAGRPALEDAGVMIVEDVAPYETMKIRILNGGHAAIAYPAGLMDIHFVHEAMQEPLVRGYLNKIETEEVLPTVPPVPGVELADYDALIESRFSNPGVADTIARLCFDGSNRQPKFILPTAADRLEAGESITGLALVSAFWCRYCAGETESGAPIAPNDPDWDRLQARAREAKTDARAFLAMDDIFGSLSRNETYVAAFTHSLRTIWSAGTRETLTRFLANEL